MFNGQCKSAQSNTKTCSYVQIIIAYNIYNIIWAGNAPGLRAPARSKYWSQFYIHTWSENGTNSEHI